MPPIQNPLYMPETLAGARPPVPDTLLMPVGMPYGEPVFAPTSPTVFGLPTMAQVGLQNNGLVQDCGISIAGAMEIPQSCS